jgi:hypothetical protein
MLEKPNCSHEVFFDQIAIVYQQISKALTTKPSPHMITKNDIAKYINTYFEQKNDF